jgi:outer membrane protein assembly factor BamB
MIVTLLATLSLFSADPVKDRHQIFEAARIGDVKKVKELLDKGVDVNARNRFGATALWFAAYKNRVEVVKLLIDRKANLDLADEVWDSTPLALASSFGQTESVKLLLAAKARGAESILIRAAMQGNADLVSAVLDHQRLAPEILGTALLLTPKSAKDVTDRLTKAGGKPLPRGSEEEQKHWKKIEGNYENPNGARLMVRLRDGVLMTAGRAGLRVLQPIEKNTFRMLGDDKIRLTFEEKDGKFVRARTGEVVYERSSTRPVVAKPGPYRDEPAIVRAPRNWPSFRGEGATGIADGQHPPAVWDIQKPHAQMWKTAIPGLGHSCPVIWGDRLFVTTAVSSDPTSELKPGLYGAGDASKDRSKHTFKIYCLDRQSSKILWERTAHVGVPRVRRHTKATHANATVATDGKHVIASFASEGLYGYDFAGKQLWKQDLGLLDAGAFNDPDLQWEAGSSPIIYRDLVIVQCDRQKDSYIAAFRVDTGKQVWRTPRDEPPSWGTPTVVESKAGAEIVANGTHAVRGYDPLTGKELWKLGRNSQITVPTPFVGDGLIFVTSGYSPVQPIYAIWPGSRGDLTLKRGVESSEAIAWSTSRGGTYMPTPIYYRGYLYTCSNAGQLTCYEARTGKMIYRELLEGKLGYTASPVAADGKLYITGEDGLVKVIEAGPTFKLLAENGVGETCLATPAIANGMIYFRTRGHVIGIGRATPKP